MNGRSNQKRSKDKHLPFHLDLEKLSFTNLTRMGIFLGKTCDYNIHWLASHSDNKGGKKFNVFDEKVRNKND